MAQASKASGRAALSAARGLKRSAASRAALVRAIEVDVIPRLLAARRRRSEKEFGGDGSDAAAVLGGAEIDLRWDDGVGAGEIHRFATLAMDAGDAAATVEARRLLAAGATFERLQRDLLAPAARLMGEFWLQDRRSFAEVSIGVARLHETLRVLEQDDRATIESAPEPRAQALLCPTPGEGHLFGVAMAAACFRRAGWRVVSATPASVAELRRTIAGGRFDAIGVSIGGEAMLDAARAAIRAARRAAPSARLLAGGPLAQLRPDLVAAVGADRVVADATAVDTIAPIVICAPS